jgi:biotin transport system substrate-specific component
MTPSLPGSRAASHALPRQLGTLILGVALLTLAAKIEIPFWPVPMTLHTLAIMGFAVFLGPRPALSIIAAYLALGAAGLPVFSGTPARGIGLAYMLGPTGGYLAGYPLGALIAGYLAALLARRAGWGWKMGGRLIAMLAGMVPVYGLGLLWLARFVPAGRVWALGAAPFLLGDLVKIALLAALSGFFPALPFGASKGASAGTEDAR